VKENPQAIGFVIGACVVFFGLVYANARTTRSGSQANSIFVMIGGGIGWLIGWLVGRLF
jgi:hypothetical protein